MLEQVLKSSNFDYLPRAMEAANLRQEVIANNIANVNTPNYRSRSVTFEDALAREIYGDVPAPGNRLQMIRTKEKHLPFVPRRVRATPNIVEDTTTVMRTDDNNVDIDIEMAELAKNQLYFNAATTQLSGYITRVKNVITSGQS